MRFLSKVCIEFRHPKKREMVFKITGNDRLVLKDAPDWITEDPMFRWAVQDGTIEVVDTAFKQKELENDPMNGAGADGKIIKDGENDVSAIVEEMAEEIGTGSRSGSSRCSRAGSSQEDLTPQEG